MVLFDFLSFATEILICYREEAELPNDPKVVTLTIFGHELLMVIGMPFFGLSNCIQPGVERLFSVHAR